MSRYRILPIGAALGLWVAVSAAGCSRYDNVGGAPKIPVVRVSSPIERKVTDYEYFTGRTDAVDYVELRARVTGYLDKINFQAGMEVKKGTVLFEIDARPYKAQLDQTNALVRQNQANFKLAESNLARGRLIAKTPGAISQEDLDKLSAEMGSASASVASAKASTEMADLNYKFTKVEAPVSGIAGRNLISTGNLVLQDNTLLATIVSVDPMYVYFDVDERTVLRVQRLIREGKAKSIRDADKTKTKLPMQFGLTNEGDTYPHEGVLDFVNNQVDTSTGTLQIRALLANPVIGEGDSRLLTPGLFLRVRVPIGATHQALLVPQSALGMDQDKKYLYVINDQSKVEYRPVNVGPQEGDGMQVVEPIKIVRSKEGVRQAQPSEHGEDSLRLGDRVIVSGLQRVRSGMTVDPKPAADERK